MSCDSEPTSMAEAPSTLDSAEAKCSTEAFSTSRSMVISSALALDVATHPLSHVGTSRRDAATIRRGGRLHSNLQYRGRTAHEGEVGAGTVLRCEALPGRRTLVLAVFYTAFTAVPVASVSKYVWLCPKCRRMNFRTLAPDRLVVALPHYVGL